LTALQGNAYSELVGLIREAVKPEDPVGPVHLRLGTVLSADPLRVDVAGTTQEGERIYISHRLVKEHRELLRLDCANTQAQFTFSSSCPHGAHGDHGDDPASFTAGTLTTPRCAATQAEPVLKPGDEVLLLTEDHQIFFLIDKVVKAG